MASDSTIIVAVADGVATVTLNRPEAMNALNMQMKEELAEAIGALGADPAVRCVVITGSGKAFCAGGDINEMELNDSPRRSRERLATLLRSLIIPLAQLEKPTIAAINGHAHGAGLSLALACDLMIAGAGAKLSCAFSRMGLLPDCGALYFLPRRVSLQYAKELVYTGRQVLADEALRMSLVSQVVPDAELATAVASLARQLAHGPTVALGLSKRLLDQSLHTGLPEMAELEALGQALLYETEDYHEARRAFLAKTQPHFTGR
jgi:2-(1,2-epoxy-1,2-dihydrophenyl)acetyl-CoA isomerase